MHIVVAHMRPRSPKPTCFLSSSKERNAFSKYDGTKCISKRAEDRILDRLCLHWNVHRLPLDDNEDKRVVILGLDRAGKTSIMQQLCVANGEQNCYSVPPPPTQGSNIYRLRNGTNTYYIWDIGGTNPTKKYWGTFLQDTDLLVFVVDASDYTKLSQAVTTLKELLGDSRIGTVPILVLANKQDSSDALSSEKVKEILDLLSIPPHQHKVEILPCQTRPLPEKSTSTSEYSWHHESIDAVRKKIFAMAT